MIFNRTSVRLYIDERKPPIPPYSTCQWHQPPHCRYRGLDVDTVISILSFLRLTIVPVIHNSTNSNRTFVWGIDYDVPHFLYSYEDIASLNVTLTQVTHEDHISVITTNTPISADRDLFALFSPFSWKLWLAIAALWLLNRILGKFRGRFGGNGTLCVQLRFSHDFRASIAASSLVLVILVSLYRSGLLTGLLMSRPRYLVESLHDIVHLPSSIKIYSQSWVWPILGQTTFVRDNHDLYKQFTKLEPNLTADLLDETILNEICGGRTIFVGLESTASYAINSCRLGGLRQQTLPIKVSYGIAVNQTATPDLVPMLNYAISHLYDTFQHLVDFYMERVPTQRICERRQVQHAAAHLGSFSLTQMSGHFGLLSVGLLVAVVVLVVEKLICRPR